MRLHLIASITALSLLSACSGRSDQNQAAPAQSPDTAEKSAAAAPRVDPEQLLQHIRVLADDSFEGRLPGTTGEDKTLDYLKQQFNSMGLKPAGTDGSWTQAVPLVGIDGKPSATLVRCSGRLTLSPPPRTSNPR